MSSVFHRVLTFPSGRRSKWVILLLWFVIAAVAGPIGGKLASVVTNDQSAYLPTDAESTKAIKLIEHFPSGQQFPAIVVAERSGPVTNADAATMASYGRDINAQVQVLHGTVSGPVPSQDGHALILIVPLQGNLDGPPIQKAVNTMRSIVDNAPPGLTVKVGGIAGLTSDEIGAFSGVDSTLLLATLIIVVVILLLTYRSPVLWIVPLIAVGMAYTLAQALVYELEQHANVLVSGETQGILTVLVFGAGTDYALLLTARYREELTRHADRHQAMAVALHRAVPAVLASASTVVLGLLCLLTASLESDRGLGPVGATGIICAFVSLATLLPALLTIFGRFLFWPFKPRAGTTPDPMSSVWGRIGTRIAQRSRAVWLATTIALVALAIGVSTLRTGVTNDQAFRTPPDSVRADTIIAAHFPAGVSNPADIIASAGSASQVVTAAQSTPGVAAARVAERTANLVRVAATLNATNGTQAAFDTISALRGRVHGISGADAVVGGESAVEYDVQTAAIHDRTVAMPLILAVVVIVLSLLLRAVVAPIMLVASVVVSYLAALGASAFLFNSVFSFAGIDQTLPLLGFVFLVALGVDYNIFLMSRVREETIQHGTRRGVLIALATTGGVITSAGFVLAATFSALSVLPLVFLTEIGVLVAVGVLLDTLIVRSILVPALVIDFGSRVWWPSRLRHDPGAGRGDVAPLSALGMPGSNGKGISRKPDDELADVVKS